MSPPSDGAIAREIQARPNAAAPRCTPGCTNPADHLSDLARLVQNWLTLPAHIKAAVMALVNTAVPTPPADPHGLNDELPLGYERMGDTT